MLPQEMENRQDQTVSWYEESHVFKNLHALSSSVMEFLKMAVFLASNCQWFWHRSHTMCLLQGEICSSPLSAHFHWYLPLNYVPKWVFTI